MQKIMYWFLTISRGYSVPMSVLNWLVVFVIALKNDGNFVYGILALLGIVFAHLGTNLFDDCVDYFLKSQKQKCKTEYLDNGFTNIKNVCVMTIIFLGITGLIGLFFFIKCGIAVAFIAFLTGIIILLYPRLNHYALGEFAVGLTFGVLLFTGVYYVMLKTFDLNVLLISIPVSLFTVAVVYTHALMDYDFDVKSGKKTLCILLGSKERALNGLMVIYALSFIFTIFLVMKNVLPITSILTFALIPLVIKLQKLLKRYINKNEHENDFIINFLTARNISVFYNLILVLCIFLEV